MCMGVYKAIRSTKIITPHCCRSNMNNSQGMDTTKVYPASSTRRVTYTHVTETVCMYSFTATLPFTTIPKRVGVICPAMVYCVDGIEAKIYILIMCRRDRVFGKVSGRARRRLRNDYGGSGVEFTGAVWGQRQVFRF